MPAPWTSTANPLTRWLIVGYLLFAGALAAVATRFFLPWEIALILAAALFFIGIVVTLLNPFVRELFFYTGAAVLGLLAATLVWTFGVFG